MLKLQVILVKLLRLTYLYGRSNIKFICSWFNTLCSKLLCKSRFSRYFVKYFSKTNKTFKAIAFYYDRPLVLIWTKFDNELFGYDVYAKNVPFPLFQIIIPNVKERIQIKFELIWTINRTAWWMHTQIWQHSMNGNQ